MHRQHLFHLHHLHHRQPLHSEGVGQMRKLVHRTFLSSTVQEANDRRDNVWPQCPPHVHRAMHFLVQFDETQEWGPDQ